jgi:hypothetical protein
MDSTSILYHDVVDGIRPILSTTTKPSEPACSICKHDYYQAATGHETTLDYFNELPFAACKTFIQHVIEPVIPPCICICAWMMQNELPTCPMCRRTIVASEHEEDSDDDSDVAGADVYVEGLSISLGISVLASQEIYRILKLSTRQVLTTTTPMPFFCSASVILLNLPHIMMFIARRFHTRARRPVLSNAPSAREKPGCPVPSRNRGPTEVP